MHYASLEKAAGQTALRLEQANEVHEEEVLAFLAASPLHTVFMAGLIRDNGMLSPMNRGDFYLSRRERGGIDGVALIGHATMFEARSEESLALFARQARSCQRAHVIVGEESQSELFWRHYAEGRMVPHRPCRNSFLTQHWPLAVHEPVAELRPASYTEFGRILRVQAQMAYEESGVDPLEIDPQGFSYRIERRIGEGRVWVWVRDGRVVFKADVMAETPEVIYLEGIYVDPQERGRGYGQRCLSQLGRLLLARTKALCLLVNEENHGAFSFYQKAGYKLHSYFRTIFLGPQQETGRLAPAEKMVVA